MQHDVLRDIHEGMKVYDSGMHEIGKVERVQFGNDDPSTPEQEAETLEGMEDGRDHSLMSDIAEAFVTDRLPEEVRERLLLQGFVRIDAEGLFAGDRYVLPDQIGSVSDGKMVLKVSKDQLFKRH